MTLPTSDNTHIEPPLRMGRKFDRVVEAAKNLFLEQGYGAVSMDAIVARAGISKSTLYSYFRSKEDLFAAVVRSVCESQVADFPINRLDPADPDKALTKLALLALNLMLSPESVKSFRTIIAESGRFPELGRAFYDAGPTFLLGLIETYLARARQDGRLDIDSVHEAAWHFIALVKLQLHDLLLWNVVPMPGEAEMATQAARAVKLFLRCYAPRDDRAAI